MYSTPARVFSLLLALTLAAVITFYPPALASLSHGLITLVIWGVSAGFVHGIGFDPDARFWRAVFGPISAWVLMGMGLLLIAKPYFSV
ncbi:cyd operon YbgE family protein [Sulfuriferula nivalis]|uniref:Cyd operon protein YbgE n=1 Tax=Sulfuriferula nivalis TaxID=2675298 RepID=A0A809RL12_9PROT|nr:cyd operon YbgE family protein [Sulfuriferula nivalis]BBP01494.1 cyd operon protein YbgE [Sulfuriferula nivalis]